MPTTYLLLRNNKQTGPHSLDELLQLSLQPHDLVWVEGRSAGWCYPSEVELLKPYITTEKETLPTAAATDYSKKTTTASDTTKPVFKNASHIYVSLPAGVPIRVTEEKPVEPSLEAKAEALYQRAQAFAHGQTTEEPETRYTRSLQDMKEEYGAWQVKLKQKKRNGTAKKKMLIAASVVIVTTTSFSISKWISSKQTLPQIPVAARYTSEPIPQTDKGATTTVSYNTATDSLANTPPEPVNFQPGVAVKELIVEKAETKPVLAKLKKAPQNQSLPTPTVADTTTRTITPPPVFEETPPKQETLKRVVPLSRLVSVTGVLANSTESPTTGNVTFQNNSSETLKSVSVVITYLRKENRQIGKETVYFYNVQPATAPVAKIAGNRRATTAQFEIGTITRADGSLYLIH